MIKLYTWVILTAEEPPVSKIMSYDRYNMKRIFATLNCRDKINFNVYFRVNISDGSSL